MWFKIKLARRMLVPWMLDTTSKVRVSASASGIDRAGPEADSRCIVKESMGQR